MFQVHGGFHKQFAGSLVHVRLECLVCFVAVKFIFIFIETNLGCQFFLSLEIAKNIIVCKDDAIGTHVYDSFLLLQSVKYVAWCCR